MAKPPINQEDFIDLYDALNLPQNADTEKIRKRVTALYLESQQNLDHRNAKKRLHYQQLFEIVLPQARHLLLDDNHRAEYDRYLTAFKTGTKVTTSEPEARRISSSKPVTVTERLKEEEGIDPKKLEEQREDLWAQWKQGLQQVEEEPEQPQQQAAAPQTPATQPTRAPELRSAGEDGEAPPGHRGFSQAALHAGETPQRVPAETKRQQEQQRIKIIKQRAKAIMIPLGFVTGIIVFLISCAVLYYATNYLTSSGYLTGTFGEIVNLGWPLAAAVIGFVSGRNAAETARQKTIEKLSRLSYEELRKR